MRILKKTCWLWSMLLGAAPLVESNKPLPPLLDLRPLSVESYLPRDARDPAQVEKARLAWQAFLKEYTPAKAWRLALPDGPNRIPLLLAASQAIKAQSPDTALYLAFHPSAPALTDEQAESAWGALDGGIVSPQDCGTDSRAWRALLMSAQEQMPGRPWYLWLDADPAEQAPVLLGDGARLVVPDNTPTARLAMEIPADFTDVEASPGDLTLSQPQSGARKRWKLESGQWRSCEPAKRPTTVRIESQSLYDTWALVAKMRATQLRDQAAIANWEAKLDVNLHMQGNGSMGIDLGLSQTAFGKQGESEEWLQKATKINGMTAKVAPGVQLPLVEAQSSEALPVALNLTEAFRYTDGGPGDRPHTRRLRFTPLSKGQGLPSGELLVEESTGRILQEKSRRDDLPGMVKSEEITLTYGEPTQGHWRIVKALAFERWVMGGNLFQVQRELNYSQFHINALDFDQRREAARASKATMLKHTPAGMRYFTLKDGVRKVEEKSKSSGVGLAGMLLMDPAMSPPVFPMVGMGYFDFNAFNKGMQIFAVSGLVYNQASLTAPRLPGGFDLTCNMAALLLPVTERPVKDGKLLDQDGVSRQWGTATFVLGKNLGWGFHLRGKGLFNYNRFSKAREEKYQTPGFRLPSSGWERGWELGLSWLKWGVQLRTHYGQSQRPTSLYGTLAAPQTTPEEGRMAEWGASASYDYQLNPMWWLHGEAGFAAGRGFDRFASLGLGGYVKGIRSYSVTADRVHYGKVGVVLPPNGFCRMTCTLDHARARSLDDQKTYGFTGLGLAGDLPGFWWFTALRLDLGIGLQSDIPGVKGVNGIITFLRAF